MEQRMAEPLNTKSKGGAPITKVGHTGLKAHGRDESTKTVNPAPYEQS
jgi:hypothetical protein